MHSTRSSWLPAAQGAGWFRLTRHDDPEPADPGPEPAPEPEGDPDPEPDPEGADKLGDAGKKALDRMKAEKAAAKKEATEERKRREAAERRVQEFEDRDKSDLEKATSRAEVEAKRAATATARAVRAEVKAAAAEFADPEDAAAFLDLARYADDSGDIDTEAIASDLADLLERKPHLRKQAPAAEPPRAPKPDPSQGPRQEPPPKDYRNASREEIQKAAAQLGVRLR